MVFHFYMFHYNNIIWYTQSTIRIFYSNTDFTRNKI